MSKPMMHCHAELLSDLGYPLFIPDSLIMKWAADSYSTSKHLLFLHVAATGLNAKVIVEIGFGRSSFILARVAAQNNGTLYACDMRDFSYLLTDAEKASVKYLHGKSNLVWENIELIERGIDFAFLDYFSGHDLSHTFVLYEIERCISLLKENGILCVHDVCTKHYHVGAAAEELLALGKKLDVLTLPYNYGLLVVRKKESSPYGKIEDIWYKKPAS